MMQKKEIVTLFIQIIKVWEASTTLIQAKHMIHGIANPSLNSKELNNN